VSTPRGDSESRAPEQSPPDVAATVPDAASFGEPRRVRVARHARRARFYASAAAFVTVLVVLAALASKNTQTAKLDWLAGSTRASLAWIILAAAVFGWLFGIATALIVNRRARRAV
jgi:uncharacterized integral membrane protein